MAKAITSCSVTDGADRRRLGDGVDPLSPLLVGQPDHHHVVEAGVLAEGRFHLGREDVGPTGDDHVHPAVGHEQPTILVEPAQVADGGEVVLGHRGGRHVAQVPVGDPVRLAQEDLTDLARREVARPRGPGS